MRSAAGFAWHSVAMTRAHSSILHAFIYLHHRYMAPEVSRGKGCCESDLFSLGALGLFMLTGVEPYRLSDKVRGANPYSGALHRLRSGGEVSQGTLSLLDALLQADPALRRSRLDSVLHGLALH
jgi:serine/threonine protein kinase